jgi:hypothetical protein
MMPFLMVSQTSFDVWTKEYVTIAGEKILTNSQTIEVIRKRGDL